MERRRREVEDQNCTDNLWENCRLLILNHKLNKKEMPHLTGLVLGILAAVLTSASILPSPLMGFITFKAFGRDYTYQNLLDTVDVLEKSNLAQKGYNMIVIDGGWWVNNKSWVARENYPTPPHNHRGPQHRPAFNGNGSPGCMIPDPKKFPQGILNFRNFLKSKNFRFGMYTSGQIYSCVSQT